MNRILRLWLLIAFCLAWPAASHAQDRAQVTRQITFALTDIALIERERARPDVADDFAAHMLANYRQQLEDGYAQADRLGQGRAIRQEAQRNANRVIGATLRTDYLRPYPDPVQVRTELAERADGANDAVIAGRQSGRLLMLYNSLKALQGDYNSFDENRWPADVVQRGRIYRLHFYDIRDRIEPTLGGACSRLPFTSCRRRDYHEARGDYQHDLEPAVDTAALYFPAGFQEQFVDSTGFGGSRAEYAQAQASRRAERERQEAMQGSPRLSATAWMFILLGMGGAAYGLYRLLKRKDEGDSLSGNYGTADYASPLGREFDESIFKGVFFGAAAHPGIPASYFGPVLSTPESHALIVAPSGTGKGTSVILPTLLLYRSSLITIDPKGENAAITARYRRDQLGHTVHIVNPWGVHDALLSGRGFSRATFNPLDLLDPKDPNIVGVANSIAVSICQHGNPNDPFWQNSASAMLAGILLWVADTPGQTKTLAHVADIVSGGENAEDLRKTLFPRMVASSSYRNAMRTLVGRFVQMDDRAYSGVIAQLSQSLQFMADDQIATATDQSSFNLADLADGKTTLYIVIPDDQMQAQAVWLKLMVDTVMQTFKRERPYAKGIRGMFLIDEFPVLGRLESMVKDIAVVRGAGLDMTLIVQGLDQLTALYGASSGTILSNCGFKWFCNVSDLQTAEYVSKALGQMTVRTVSQTISANDGSTNRSLGETGRALLFPDEIMSLGNQAGFVFRPGGRAYYVRLMDYRNLHAYVAPRVTVTAAPRLPDLKAYDPNPFYQQSGQRQHGGAGSNGEGADNDQTGGGSDQSAGSNGQMDRAEALAMLGLMDGATAEQVREAYKNLIGKMHPDRGGTNRIAQLLNEARDLLLAKRR